MKLLLFLSFVACGHWVFLPSMHSVIFIPAVIVPAKLPIIYV